MVTLPMGSTVISAKTVGEHLPLRPEQSLKITRFPARNGWNRFSRSLAMRVAAWHQRMAETPLPQRNIGMPSYSEYCTHTRRILFFPDSFRLMKHTGMSVRKTSS